MAAPALTTMRQAIKEEASLILQTAAAESASLTVSASGTTAAQAARQVVAESPVAMRGVVASAIETSGRGGFSGAIKHETEGILVKEMASTEPSILQQHMQIVKETMCHPSIPTPASNNIIQSPARSSSPITSLLTSKTFQSTSRSAARTTTSTTTTTSSTLLNPESAVEIKEAVSQALQEGVEEQLDQVQGMLKAGGVGAA